MFTLKNVLTAAMLATLSLSPHAAAALSELEFTAVALLPDGSGDTVDITGYYLLDTETELTSDTGTLASYARPIIEGHITVGTTVYEVNAAPFLGRLQIRNRPGDDLFSLQSTVTLDAGFSATLDLSLYDTSGTIFDSTAFPEFGFDLADFDPSIAGSLATTGFGTVALPGGVDVAYHELTNVTYRVVPVPAAAWLLLSALGLLGIRFGRRPT